MWPFIERREEREERGEERREEWVLLPPPPKTYKSEVGAPDRDTIRYDTVESVWTHRTGSLSLR